MMAWAVGRLTRLEGDGSVAAEVRVIGRAPVAATLACAGALFAACAGCSAVADARAHATSLFTLAGGGTEKPRDGLPATLADLDAGVSSLSPLPDGTVAFTLGSGRAYTVAEDGVLRALPRITADGRAGRIAEMTARPDGALLAVTWDGGFVYRLRPGASAWEQHFALDRIPGWGEYIEVIGLVGLAEGFVLDAWDFGIWRVSDAGAVDRVRLPRRGGDPSLLALPGGRLGALLSSGSITVRDRVVELRPDGTHPTLLRFRLALRTPAALVGTPDGGFLRGSDVLERIRPDGSIEMLGGHRPGLGAGDGGPIGGALLSIEQLAPMSDGALLLSGTVPGADPSPSMDLRATRIDGRLITDSAGYGDTVIRALVRRDTSRPLVAIAPRTFTALRGGQVSFVSTFSGHATLRVERGRRVIATLETEATAGVNRVSLPFTPPRAALRLVLTLAAADGRSSSAHLAVTTERRLRMKRARRLLRQFTSSEGDSEAYRETLLGRCGRASRTRIECRAIDVSGAPGLWERRRCAAVLIAVLRADGVRGLRREGARSCRAIAVSAGPSARAPRRRASARSPGSRTPARTSRRRPPWGRS